MVSKRSNSKKSLRKISKKSGSKLRTNKKTSKKNSLRGGARRSHKSRRTSKKTSRKTSKRKTIRKKTSKRSYKSNYAKLNGGSPLTPAEEKLKTSLEQYKSKNTAKPNLADLAQMISTHPFWTENQKCGGIQRRDIIVSILNEVNNVLNNVKATNELLMTYGHLTPNGKILKTIFESFGSGAKGEAIAELYIPNVVGLRDLIVSEMNRSGVMAK